MLVVDDSRFVRASLVRALSPRFRIRQADAGERAWELLLLDPSIGAVLSDLSMPGMDGLELLRRVRGSMLGRVRELPFAVLSGADDPEQRRRAEALGADRFVVKGDGVDALGDWIESRLAETPAPQAVVQATAPEPTPSEPTPSDPLRRWFEVAIARPSSPGDAPPALLRLDAPGLDAVPARLRRGVRAADALHVDGVDAAWLCVPASGPLALRLALRFGLLAAGRLAAVAGPAQAGVSVCLHAVDPARPGDALEALRALTPWAPPSAGLSLRVLAGPWGPAWQCGLPWPAVRLLVS